ncbi:MAG: DnaJ domain-containing protein [Methylocystaceae bacterium]|nr:DnaJ domain-containing protein [Methylocystaceae bacterium]
MIFYLILGLFLVIAGYALLHWYVRADPKDVLYLIKWGGAIIILLLFAWLALSGKLAFAFGTLPVLFIWFQRFRTVFQIVKGVRRFFGKTQQSPKRSGQNMTREEALSILGLEEGASKAEIKAAYHRVIKEAHPDHGGSDDWAATVNRAKDVLLND